PPLPRGRFPQFKERCVVREVVVDGVRYVPEGDSGRIGVAVTTHNRAKVFRKSLEELRRHTPGVNIIVVDDGSSEPVEDADFRFDEPQGVAAAKNKCFELLYAQGAE